MSQYTTGQIAKLCGITVRTVQYYDDRGLLIPSELTEGGRWLYSEEDLKRLQVICFLRSLDLSINTIAQLLAEDHPENVIDLLLQQQEQILSEEIELRQEKLEKLKNLQRRLKTIESFTVESIGDVANVMENKKKLMRIRWNMIIIAVLGEVVEVGTLIYSINAGIWWPFLAVGLPVVVTASILLCWHYFTHVDYICPQCHEVFKPKFKEAFWANHTPTTRKLTCPHCGHKGFCVETCGGK